MRRLAPALVAALLAPLSGCGSERTRPATLAMSPTFVCEVGIGDRTARVILDTGSEPTLLGEQAVARLQLRVRRHPHRVLLLTDATGEERRIEEHAAVDALRVGTHAFVVGELPSVPFGRQVTADGVLGMDVMQHAAWWFDAPRNEVHVLDGDAIDAFVAAKERRVTARLPIGGSARRPMVRVQLEGRLPVDLLLDTGTERTTLPADVLATLALPSGQDLARRLRSRETAELTEALERAGLAVTAVQIAEEDGSRVGIHGEPSAPRPLFHLHRLELGGRVVQDLVVCAPSGSGAVLGRDVLATFAWILDVRRRQLCLLSPP